MIQNRDNCTIATADVDYSFRPSSGFDGQRAAQPAQATSLPIQPTRLRLPRNLRRGARGTPEHAAWQNMQSRCYLPNHPMFRYYGARGIGVCHRWQASFADFLSDVGPRPTAEHSIDRIDVNAHYEPGNVRWATSSEQARNKTSATFIDYLGSRMALATFAELIGICAKTVSSRLRYGWTPEQIASTPSSYSNKLKNVARGIERTVHHRACERCLQSFIAKRASSRFCTKSCASYHNHEARQGNQ